MDIVTPGLAQTPAATPRPTAETAAISAEAEPVISSDFETFLTMLTAQLENQDPLNPMDSSDYAVQLATFSNVEQQVLTNDLLKQLVGAGGLGGHAGWVGMEARSDAPVAFSGAPIDLHFEAKPGATRTEILVRDAGGTEMQRFDVTNAAPPYSWTGDRGDGSVLPAGTYGFELITHRGEAAPESSRVESYARIAEVRNGAGGPEVVLEGGSVIPANSVSALR